MSSGFSNLADETVSRHALTAARHDSLTPSFGLECARQFLLGDSSRLSADKKNIILESDSEQIEIPVDDRQMIRINHIRNLNRIPSMSLVDLFQTFHLRILFH